jgi:hypothetical protein
MNETCDRCGPAVRAVYRVEGYGELYLCGHCKNWLRAAPFAQGWTICPACEHAVAPQAHAGVAASDWLVVGPEGSGVVDVRLAIQTDEGAAINMQYNGRLEASQGVDAQGSPDPA